MTYQSLMNKWPTLAAFARDIGVDYEIVKKWKQRNSIPSIHWPAVVEAGKQRDIDVTILRLCEMQQSKAA